MRILVLRIYALWVRSTSKSNEITAIPLVIEELDITDAVVSIDAIGCQREIAKQIVDKGGHYLLSLKENQQDLYDDVVCGFTRTSYPKGINT